LTRLRVYSLRGGNSKNPDNKPGTDDFDEIKQRFKIKDLSKLLQFVIDKGELAPHQVRKLVQDALNSIRAKKAPKDSSKKETKKIKVSKHAALYSKAFLHYFNSYLGIKDDIPIPHSIQNSTRFLDFLETLFSSKPSIKELVEKDVHQFLKAKSRLEKEELKSYSIRQVTLRFSVTDEETSHLSCFFPYFSDEKRKLISIDQKLRASLKKVKSTNVDETNPKTAINDSNP
jgi:hypothetical protein